MKQLLRTLLIEPIRSGLMGALAPYERRLIREAGAPEEPPVFIIGPPRSGTTLVYEALVSGYHFSYLSNLAHRLPKTPAAATRLGAQWIRNHRGKFESRFGHIEGWGAPNEGGAIWNRWFPRDIYLDGEYVRNVPVDEARGTIGAIARALDGPFLNKNVMHSVHLELLDRLFPDCLFVDIRRDPEPNIRSIAKMRLKEATDKGGTPIEWEGVKPRAWKKYEHEDFVRMACAQVYHVREEIDAGARIVGQDRFFRIDYKNFCEQPRETMEDLMRFLSNRGVTIEGKHEIPERFYVSEGKPLDSDLERRIREGVNKLWG